MPEKTGGKRLALEPEKSGGGGKTLAVILAAVLAVLLCAYIALCAYAHRDIFWKGTSVMGVDVSGLNTAQAAERLSSELPRRWARQSLTLSGGGASFTLAADGLVEPGELGQTLNRAAYGGRGRDTGFLALGIWYIDRALSREGVNIVPELSYTEQGRQRVDSLLSQVMKRLEDDGRETVCRYGKDELIFIKGRSRVKVDEQALRRDIALALAGAGGEEIAVSREVTAPAEPDFDAIYSNIFSAASAAYLDRESGEIVPSVVGREFDIAEARSALEAAQEGEVCRVELTLTVPSPTTEELNELLFRDVLGEASTRVTGTADRHMNVGVAAAFLNGHIVFPGEEFSFNKVCSPYTVENGYGKATAYVNGLSKDTVAGGICQASSTLYWATLRANLETVERSAHRYEPTYIRGGLDATVYGDYGDEGGLDFRFRNTSQQPIRLEAYVDGKNNLHVLIHGTDTTGIHGEPYSANRVVTQAYQTIYEARDSVPQGTTRKDPERTGYNGVSIETYQKLVDAEGKVVEEKLLYKTRYYVRNEVIFFNPADIWLWNIDPLTGQKLETTPQPETTQSPEETGAPAAPSPEETPPGAQGEESAPPAGSLLPGTESGEPQLPPSATPQPTPQPTPPAYDPDEPLLPPGL